MTEPVETPSSDRPPISAARGLAAVGLLGTIAVVLAVMGIVPRLRARTDLQKRTDALAVPQVLAARPRLGEPSSEIVLPGNVQAFTDAPIYARTSGYLKSWRFDIGARVKKGERLAVIASPEVDQQLASAKAELATARATAKNAQLQSARYRELLKDNAVSQQDTDNFASLASSTGAQVEAAAANVQRLQQLIDFQTVTAPFDGIITARNVDVGTLVEAGAARELFHLSNQDVLRVYVNVPQTYARTAVPGVVAALSVAEIPDRRFEGKIVRTSNAIDPVSRTLLVEVDVDNHDRALFPGAYTQVHFKLATARPALILPVPALIFRSEGLRVAVVRGDHVKLVPITIGHDDGKTVEVVEGLQANDLVVQSPSDSLADGDAVQLVQAPAEESGDRPARAAAR
jgi:RND family efflux transporter MFP subunit